MDPVDKPSLLLHLPETADDDIDALSEIGDTEGWIGFFDNKDAEGQSEGEGNDGELQVEGERQNDGYDNIDDVGGEQQRAETLEDDDLGEDAEGAMADTAIDDDVQHVEEMLPTAEKEFLGSSRFLKTVSSEHQSAALSDGDMLAVSEEAARPSVTAAGAIKGGEDELESADGEVDVAGGNAEIEEAMDVDDEQKVEDGQRPPALLGATKPITRGALSKDPSLAAAVTITTAAAAAITNRRASGRTGGGRTARYNPEATITAALSKSGSLRPFNAAKMAAIIPALVVNSPTLFRTAALAAASSSAAQDTNIMDVDSKAPVSESATNASITKGHHSEELNGDSSFGASALSRLQMDGAFPNFPAFEEAFASSVTIPEAEKTSGPLPDFAVESCLLPLPAWPPAELDAMDRGLEACGKNFSRVSREYVPTRSTAECIEAYYSRKHVLRYTKIKSYKKNIKREDEEYVRYISGTNSFKNSETRRLKYEKSKGTTGETKGNFLGSSLGIDGNGRAVVRGGGEAILNSFGKDGLNDYRAGVRTRSKAVD
ncbi:hypothetical protein HK101_001340 [Irineochytrium annulatum]|nr:hypothetical protein HK101_001340 [Irineochytrium annulatum]